MQQLLSEIIEQTRPLIGQGKVASYIPALANVNPNQLGIAVLDKTGQLHTAGDAYVPFSIQSISKLLSLTLALELYGNELWQFVGKEPSGQAFNSLIQLEIEHGIPRNPFINAGAIRVVDLLHNRLATPQLRLQQLAATLAENPDVKIDHLVAASEYEHRSRNAAMAYLMKSFDRFDNDVESVLSTYFGCCAITMNCVDLVHTFSYLANSGISVKSQQRIVTAQQTKQLNALLATCGLYDEAGEFAYRVGMPGKSGVGGGIIAVIPNELTVAVFSPELNPYGNSHAGCALLEAFSTRLGRSIY